MEQLLKSDKKVCDRHTLLRTLEAIYYFGVGEGEGGRSAVYSGGGESYPGTGLRAPKMPLHNMPKAHRRCVLRHLINKGLIRQNKDFQQLTLTKLGAGLLLELNRCPKCEEPYWWYTWKGHVQTDVHSGYSIGGKTRMCKCEYEARTKRMPGVLRSSHSSSIGVKIEPKVNVDRWN